MLESRTATLNEFDSVKVKQLDYCNAFVRTCINGGFVERIELVSYCTPVVAIGLNHDGKVHGIECAPAAVCSATTRTHVGRFLNEYYPALSYSDVKAALNTVPKQRFGNGLRCIVMPDRYVCGLYDVKRLFDVRYESIKPFQA